MLRVEALDADERAVVGVPVRGHPPRVDPQPVLAQVLHDRHLLPLEAVPARDEVLPERPDVGRLGETAAHADDGHGRGVLGEL
ncbi:hypothetical protein SAURM35S_08523 [Streptomyces aurantiogriseus]